MKNILQFFANTELSRKIINFLFFYFFTNIKIICFYYYLLVIFMETPTTAILTMCIVLSANFTPEFKYGFSNRFKLRNLINKTLKKKEKKEEGEGQTVNIFLQIVAFDTFSFKAITIIAHN